MSHELHQEPSRQEEMPFAVVQGEEVTTLPRDLYIPPDALRIFLEAFEGPLDLLLYLIKRQNLDILDIPLAQITQQYMSYIDLMREMRLELAGDYLVMAAMLAEIKSRMLLPRPPTEEEYEEDPRAELIRRLQEYERYKQAAEDVGALNRMERDIHVGTCEITDLKVTRPLPQVTLHELLLAFQEAMARARRHSHHHVQRDALSVRERMAELLDGLRGDRFTELKGMFRPEEGRPGVVVTLLAILELIKESLVELVQTEAFATIHLKATVERDEEPTERMS